MDEFYIDFALNLLHDMRLRIEGAVVLYERHAIPLRRLGVENDMPVAVGVYDTIGSALYDLRENIQELYDANMKEANRLSKQTIHLSDTENN